MAALKYGIFTNPMPTSLSDLVNDKNYMAIREYILDSSSLSGTTQVAINDLLAGSTITKISLNIMTPFKSSNATDTIEVVSDSGIVLLDKSWNDPSIKSNYETDAFYVTSGNTNEIFVKHTLSGMTAGLAVLRVELYENITEYEALQTQSGEDYITTDNKTVEVTTE